MTEKNLVQTIHDTLWDEMHEDDRVLVLGEDVGARGGVFRVTAGFLDEFGEERVVDTPLAESGIVGVADVKREGEDLTVVAYGLMLHLCLEAVQRLEEEDGYSAEVVDVRTISPLDKKTILDSVRKTSKAMVVYEDNRTYGAGAEIAATIAEELMFELDGPIVRVGGPDIPAMPFSSPLEHFYMPDADRIYEHVRELAKF